ncbi:tripartite tricarboxylate transporter substrate binding protein [Siccirubricoccus sp. KC 17139]|uniref:Tripartite tricarboxylate transporter substrate binding protein n=1 Tax=Siccirubricoccus soli TaxID=2899147 RepID=A0ABT1D6H6_9PROT|nr:tripartite tricarboxylate transporter substrate binding protein [Siccirubricoccus soli]MCO6417532.1 tripartite tricarboxylate transporter substrate binding protein [Siccirubricoccus soli]MCP2683667.1 tripartite tricarboxylate transporter substrate binding protein [Siccirubricoccus soli]
MLLPRRALFATPLLATPCTVTRALAQPARPVTLVVPYAAGGGTDITGREFAQVFAPELNQTVVVDNRGGAAGHVGSVSVARARPDDTTLLFAVSTNIVVNPHLQRGDRIDLATALAPVAQVSSYQYLLVVHPDVPAQNLAELLAFIRSRPAGELTYSSGGVGNANHLAGLLFSEAAKVQMEHVPYRGTAPALMDVVAGRVTMNFSSPPPAIPLVREGKLRAIAVTGEKRIATLPDVPTLTEAGLPGAVITGWHGVFAPAGMEPAQLERLSAAAKRAAATAKFRERLAHDGLEPAPERPLAEFAAAVRQESDFWAQKAKELDLKLE